jgi:hypothetical protein
MTTAQNEQVLTLYEESNIALKDIADFMELELSVIKLFLMTHSEKYRSTQQHNADVAPESGQNEDDFGATEYELARRVVSECLMSDRESMRLRAAQTVIKARGKKSNPLNGLRGLNLSVSNFNIMIERSKRAKELALEKVIDMEERPLITAGD